MPKGVYERSPEILVNRRAKMRVYLLSADERFWRHVERVGNCLVWTGTVNQYGYGRFRSEDSVRGKRVLAHRFAWKLSGRVLAKGKVLHHKCNNRLCVNVDHLVPMRRDQHQTLHAKEIYGRH